MFLPGLAFDHKMNRVGRGKGYYDKFLKDSDTLKVGLSLSTQILDDVPVESHDVKMDKVLYWNKPGVWSN